MQLVQFFLLGNLAKDVSIWHFLIIVLYFNDIPVALIYQRFWFYIAAIQWYFKAILASVTHRKYWNQSRFIERRRYYYTRQVLMIVGFTLYNMSRLIFFSNVGMINNPVITHSVGWSLMVMSHGGSNNFNELDITRSGNLKTGGTGFLIHVSCLQLPTRLCLTNLIF